MRYLHTMVRVQDLEKSLDFYCNKLGLVETRRYDNEKGKFTLVFLAAPEDLEQAKTKMTPVLELTYNWETEEYSKGRNFLVTLWLIRSDKQMVFLIPVKISTRALGFYEKHRRMVVNFPFSLSYLLVSTSPSLLQ